MSFDDHEPNQAQGREAAEWGLASILMAGVLDVLAMLMLHMNLYLFLSPPVWGASDLRALFYAAVAGAIVMLGLCCISTAFAVRSLLFAVRRGQRAALGLAGLLLSMLALALWVGTLADLFAVVHTMMRRQGMGGLF